MSKENDDMGFRLTLTQAYKLSDAGIFDNSEKAMPLAYQLLMEAVSYSKFTDFIEKLNSIGDENPDINKLMDLSKELIDIKELNSDTDALIDIKIDLLIKYISFLFLKTETKDYVLHTILIKIRNIILTGEL